MRERRGARESEVILLGEEGEGEEEEGGVSGLGNSYTCGRSQSCVRGGGGRAETLPGWLQGLAHAPGMPDSLATPATRPDLMLAESALLSLILGSITALLCPYYRHNVVELGGKLRASDGKDDDGRCRDGDKKASSIIFITFSSYVKSADGFSMGRFHGTPHCQLI